jgi:hypothetical protein
MRRCAFAALMMVSAMPAAAVGGEARAQFTVTARVTARASIDSVAQPTQFTVSAGDVDRGYVDLAAIYRVSSNDPAGYVVRLAPRVGLTRAIEVTGLASPVVVRDDVVDVSQPAALRPLDLRLSFRLLLDEAAVPGTYSWPVQLQAYTL